MSEAHSYFHSVTSASLSTRIVAQVLDALFADQFEAGDHIGTEKNLCESFSASRFPVREALGKLSSMGVVRVVSGQKGGIKVAHPDRALLSELIAVQFKLEKISIDEMFDARILIECEAIRLTAQNATGEQIEGFRSLLNAAQTEANKPDATHLDVIPLTRDLRFALVEACGNRATAAFARANIALLYHLSVEYAEIESIRMGFRSKSLESVISHIENRDADAAEKRYREHLTRHKKDMIERFTQANRGGD